MGIPCPKPVPSAITKRHKRLDAEKTLKDAYTEVDLRDGGYCWITGRYTQSGAVDARVRREHHHLVSRSVDPTRIADPHNIITACAEAHALFKAGWLVSEGDDARKPIFFHWAAHVDAKDKPFTIQARRQRTDA